MLSCGKRSINRTGTERFQEMDMDPRHSGSNNSIMGSKKVQGSKRCRLLTP